MDSDGFLRLAQSRRSAHHFCPKAPALSDAVLEQLFEPVKYTPSGYNAQPWEVVVIREPQRLKELQKLAYNQSIITTAKTALIWIADTDFGHHQADRIVRQWIEYRGFSPAQAEALRSSLVKNREPWKKREMAIRNVSLAGMAFLFSAENLGYAACPMMGFRSLELKRFLQLPESYLPVLLMAVGTPDKNHPEPERLPRKPLTDWVWDEQYQNPFAGEV